VLYYKLQTTRQARQARKDVNNFSHETHVHRAHTSESTAEHVKTQFTELPDYFARVV